jgi:hypothetical protein
MGEATCSKCRCILPHPLPPEGQGRQPTSSVAKTPNRKQNPSARWNESVASRLASCGQGQALRVASQALTAPTFPLGESRRLAENAGFWGAGKRGSVALSLSRRTGKTATLTGSDEVRCSALSVSRPTKQHVREGFCLLPFTAANPTAGVIACSGDFGHRRHS